MKKIILLLMLVLPVSVLAYSENSALDYLENNQDSPWAIMALSGLGRSSLDTDFLKSADTSEAIKFEADILAITSLGEDPRSFGDTDLVARLQEFYSNSQLGVESQLNDDIFGGLALISSGVNTSEDILQGVKEYVVDNQNANGSWGWQIGSQDIDTTASAIMFLSEMGLSSGNSEISQALDWLKASQNTDAGWPWDPNSSWGTDSTADSTAWVIGALQKLGEDLSEWNNPEIFLEDLQTADGYFEYQSGFGESSFSKVTTSYAVLALAGKSYPVNTISYTEPSPEPDPEPTPVSDPDDSNNSSDGDDVEQEESHTDEKKVNDIGVNIEPLKVVVGNTWTLHNPYKEELHLMDYVLVDSRGRKFTIPEGKKIKAGGFIRFPAYYLKNLDGTGKITILTPSGEIFKVLRVSKNNQVLGAQSKKKSTVKVLQFNNSTPDRLELVDYYLRDSGGNIFTLPSGKFVEGNGFVRMPKSYTQNLDMSGKIEFVNPENEVLVVW